MQTPAKSSNSKLHNFTFPTDLDWKTKKKNLDAVGVGYLTAMKKLPAPPETQPVVRSPVKSEPAQFVEKPRRNPKRKRASKEGESSATSKIRSEKGEESSPKVEEPSPKTRNGRLKKMMMMKATAIEVAAPSERELSVTIPLADHEIHRDIISITGRRPSKKPKARPRTIQKKMDLLFPGLQLLSITADSYKV